ncbi:MAG: serine protease [Desulfobacteraceae bacterium]|nr:MAG: serine protease [Desulfobacteraceae bacterium]
MNSNLFMPLILQIAGVMVIIAEIIIPSGGILSMIAAGLIGYSLYYVFSELSAVAGYLFVLADAVLLPLLVFAGLKLLARSPLTLRRTLSSKEGVTSQSPELENLLGRKGVAMTDLRPSGKALIAGKKVDVASRGDYIRKGEQVVVVIVSGNQVIVEKNRE